MEHLAHNFENPQGIEEAARPTPAHAGRDRPCRYLNTQTCCCATATRVVRERVGYWQASPSRQALSLLSLR